MDNTTQPHRRKRRHSRHSKKRSPLATIIKFAERNTLKAVAILFLVALVYITYLFYQSDKEQNAAKARNRYENFSK